MTLVDLLRSPWAIVPDRLLEMQAIYAQHLAGEVPDIAAIEAKLGRPLSAEAQQYEMQDGGIAVLRINGAIAPKANLFTQICGGAAASLLVKQIESMAVDARVKGVVLAWDSPGGSVFGIPALEKAIKALSDVKPTASVSDGMMCSAAYWAGSAANSVYASGETDSIGSIGVVATHTYDPRSATKQVTEVTAGKYKRIISDSKPLSAEGQAYMQGQVDEIYSVFLETVAANRRVSVDQVLNHMADGRVFIGRQAASAGLVDGVMTVDAVAEKMAAAPEKFASRHKAVFASSGTKAASQASVVQSKGEREPAANVQPTTQEEVMSAKELAATFAAENPEAAALLRAEGASAEQARAAAVRAQVLPGHEALIEKLASDGQTTGAEAAALVVAAERERLTNQAKARAVEGVKPVAQAAAETDPEPKPSAAADKLDVLKNPAALDEAAKKYMAANPGVNYLAAVAAVTQGA